MMKLQYKGCGTKKSVHEYFMQDETKLFNIAVTILYGEEKWKC
jgi:hypothetical protein